MLRAGSRDRPVPVARRGRTGARSGPTARLEEALVSDRVRYVLSLTLALGMLLSALPLGVLAPGAARAADTTPPTISAVQVSAVTATGATVGWTTDEAS